MATVSRKRSARSKVWLWYTVYLLFYIAQCKSVLKHVIKIRYHFVPFVFKVQSILFSFIVLEKCLSMITKLVSIWKHALKIWSHMNSTCRPNPLPMYNVFTWHALLTYALWAHNSEGEERPNESRAPSNQWCLQHADSKDEEKMYVKIHKHI